MHVARTTEINSRAATVPGRLTRIEEIILQFAGGVKQKVANLRIIMQSALVDAGANTIGDDPGWSQHHFRFRKISPL